MSILIYRLGSLGDTVVALPALRLVEAAFPDQRRIMLTNYSRSTKAAPLADILDNTALVHEYLEYPLFLRDPKAILDLRRKIRATGAQVLVNLNSPRGRLKSLRDVLFFKFCGIKKFVGLPWINGHTRRLEVGRNVYEYEGTRLLRSINELGQQNLDDPISFDLSLSADEEAEADRLLSEIRTRPLIAVSVGAKLDIKDWGHDNWQTLIPLLSDALPGWGLVMIGASDERNRSEDLMALWAGEKINLCGTVRVRVSAAVLQRTKVFVGHDSGPMHLAAAVGTPCVAIFSSQNWRGEWFPHGSQHKIFYTEIECQGCRLDSCDEKGKACIRAISSNDVVTAVVTLRQKIA